MPLRFSISSRTRGLLAFIIGVTASSFTQRSTLPSYVWFDETCNFAFACYGPQSMILYYFGEEAPGSFYRAAVGYSADRYQTPNDPFVSLYFHYGIITSAELKLGVMGELEGPSAAFDCYLNLD